MEGKRKASTMQGKNINQYLLWQKKSCQISQHWFLNPNLRNSKTLLSLPNIALLGNYLPLYMVHEKKKNSPTIYTFFQHFVLLKINWPPRCDHRILGALKVIILRRWMLKYLDVKWHNACDLLSNASFLERLCIDTYKYLYTQTCTPLLSVSESR